MTHFHADLLWGHLELAAAASGAVVAYGSVAEAEFESWVTARQARDGVAEG